MPRVVLNYFDCRGRGHPIRILLEDALPLSVAYAERHVALERAAAEWPQLKNDPDFAGPYSTLPVLHWIDDDGKTHVVAQTLAIYQYLGRRLGLYPTDDLDTAARIDGLLSVAYLDVYTPIVTALWQFDENAEKITAFDKLPCALRSLERMLAQVAGGGGYFVFTDRATIADYFLFAAFEFLKFVAPSMLASYPLLASFEERFRTTHTRVAAYLASDRCFSRCSGAPREAAALRALRARYAIPARQP